MAIDYSGFAISKPEPRARTKRRQKRQARKVVQSVRARVVERAGMRCERCRSWCGVMGGHAHHRKPRSLGGQWTMRNIIYLCPFCHAEAHTKGA